MESVGSQTTEQAILDAAECCFLERGFSATSTTEVARRAGCNQALVHYYFRTKDKLFEAIFLRKAPLFFSAFFNPDLGGLPFEERMRARVEAHFDVLAANPRVPFLVINEVFVNPARLEGFLPTIREVLKGSVTMIQAELDEECRAGRVRPLDAVDFMLCVVSLNIGFFVTQPIFKAVMDPTDQELARRLAKRKADNVDFVLRYLRG